MEPWESARSSRDKEHMETEVHSAFNLQMDRLIAVIKYLWFARLQMAVLIVLYCIWDDNMIELVIVMVSNWLGRKLRRGNGPKDKNTWKRNLKKEMEARGFQYNWRRIETAGQDRAWWRRVWVKSKWSNCAVSAAVSARHAGWHHQDTAGPKHWLWGRPNEDPMSGQPGRQSAVTAGVCTHGLVQNCQHSAPVSTVFHIRFILNILFNDTSTMLFLWSTVMPSSHHRHRQDKTVLSRPWCTVKIRIQYTLV